jgi:beta-glucosidase
MATYASWKGERLHGHHHLLTTVLKGELAFRGFVISDWMAVDQLDPDYRTAVEQAVNAGVDMVMVPFDYERFITTLVDLVDSGGVPEERIDDAVGRILYVKMRLGIMSGSTEIPFPLEVIGCSKHRELARVAVRASAVVLVDRGVLPIPKTEVLAAGEALDDIGIACGGWTISWKGSRGNTTQGSTILDGLRRHLGADRVHYDRDGALGSATAPYGIVAIHELPYVEGGGDRADLSVDPAQIDLVRRMRDRVEQLVVVVVSGRPLLIEPIIEVADAVVACWLPGSEADGIADVLTGAAAFTGKLPVAWPRSMEQITGEIDPTSRPPAWPIGHTAAAAP